MKKGNCSLTSFVNRARANAHKDGIILNLKERNDKKIYMFHVLVHEKILYISYLHRSHYAISAIHCTLQLHIYELLA